MKILVADDDPVSRRLLERTLQHSGYEVITAENGRQAARILAQENGPRLALVDWMMPELDGPGVCRKVRARLDGPYIYIMLLTSPQSGGDVVEGLEAGADDYLTKPCHPAELKARLHTGRRILLLEDKLVEAREEMRFKATHDALTSLWDRGAILSLLRAELARSVRERKPLSLLLCDVDYFKAINDRHGHLIGDEVLQEVSTRLLSSVRASDEVGRCGGEEFLVLLSGCSRESLYDRAEQVRSVIGVLPFNTQHGPLPVTMSIGAVTVEEWDTALPIEPLLKRVDDALYQAKARGRDCIAYAEPITTAPSAQTVPSGQLVISLTTTTVLA